MTDYTDYAALARFYAGKRVFVTGHTGFKGSWLCHMLAGFGAAVTGYSLEPPTEPSLWRAMRLHERAASVIGDVRDYDALSRAFAAAEPEIVLHLAAQPIVRASYRDPRYTYETNVMGTVNLCECVRVHGGVRSFLNVTTDKVYQNREWHYGYREIDPLDGFDPYSNSKSCSELVTHSYTNAFFAAMGVAASTARAGNVIGGGDFAPDRIIPDCVRTAARGDTIIVRNPDSTRPFQHVLEPLTAYLALAAAQYDDAALAGCYNVGPDDCDCVTTGALADLFCAAWGDARWEHVPDGGPHEATFLKLDSSLIRAAVGWRPRWHMDTAVEKTVSFYRAFVSAPDAAAGGAADTLRKIADEQIADYFTPRHPPAKNYELRAKS